MGGGAAEAFSVVLICRNEASYVEGCLRSLEASILASCARIQVVLVDGASEDATVQTAERWAAASPVGSSVRVLRLDRAGYASQRNAGVTAATAPWIVFLSADTRVPRTWVSRTREVLSREASMAIGRCTLESAAGRGAWMAPLTRTLYPSVTDEPSVERCSTVHLAVRRACLLENPFDERLRACEDKDLAFRVCRRADWQGATLLPEDVQHLARETFPRFLCKVYLESREMRVIAHQHGRSFPDCFGWRSHLRRTAAVFFLAAVAVAASQALAGLGAAAALAAVPPVMVIGGRHRPGWRRRPAGMNVILAIRHGMAMWAVVAGGVAGATLTARPCPRVPAKSDALRACPENGA
jgi:glycosyltransferase involved in cell wall biosynthesis